MPQISDKIKVKTQKFNCPVLKGVAILEFKYRVLSIGKELNE